MLISKENAERIAQKSYLLFELGIIDECITYKKAMEFDKVTGKKVLLAIEEKLEIADMKAEVKALGGKVQFGDSEIIIIDNYQYLESISYELAEPKKDKVLSIDVKMLYADSVSISPLNYFYAPHIYGHMLISRYKNGDYPRIDDPDMRVVYLKAIITEDRKVNPYVIREEDIGNKFRFSYCFPMEEALRRIVGFNKEIELLNDLFKVTNGNYFLEEGSRGYTNISIKITVLFLESIGEVELANRFRKYDNEEMYEYLKLVLFYAEKGFYGMSFNGKRKQVKLL